MRVGRSAVLGVGRSAVLGVAQGAAEVVPVSSSAQLVLLPWLLRWEQPADRTTFAAGLHAGSCLGIAWALRGELRGLDRRTLALLAASSLPAAIAGAAVTDRVEERLGRPPQLAALLAAAGALMWWVDARQAAQEAGVSLAGAAQQAGVSSAGATYEVGLAVTVRPGRTATSCPGPPDSHRGTRTETLPGADTPATAHTPAAAGIPATAHTPAAAGIPATAHTSPIDARQAALASLAQVVALIPGVSRSGATLTALRAAGVGRAEAERFSLLMSLPVTAGAAALTLARAERRSLRAMAPGLASGTTTATLAGAVAATHLRARPGRPLAAAALYRLGLAAVVTRRLVREGAS